MPTPSASIMNPGRVVDYRSDFLEYLRETSRSPRSIKGFATDLDQFAEFARQRAVEKLTTRDVVKFLEGLEAQHDRKPNTIRRKLATVRRFFQFLVQTGVIDANPATSITMPSSPHTAPRPLTTQQCRRLIAAARSDPQWLALMLLLLTTGMKREEALGLDWDDVEWRRDGMARRLTVRNPGSRAVPPRTLSLPRTTGRALAQLARALDMDWPPRGAVFGLSPRGFDYAVRRCAERAGLGERPVTARLLRDTFAVQVLAWLSVQERRQGRLLSQRGREQLRRGYEGGFLRVLGVGRNAALVARYRAALAESEEPDGTEGLFLRHGDFASADEL